MHRILVGSLPLLALSLACARVLEAGRLESKGLLDEARARARSARPPAMAALFLATVVPFTSRLPFPRGLAVPAIAASSAFLVVLAALTGKPRPTGWFATALLGAAVVALYLVR